MSTALRTRSIALASTVALTAAALFTPMAASAREGSSSKSVGNGVKCRTVVTTDKVSGKVTVTQVCAKGV